MSDLDRYIRIRNEHGGYWRGQRIGGVTGTIAAGLASGSAVFTARYPAAGLGRVLVRWLHLHYVCIAAFTTPVTASRRLALQRGSGADPSGGAAGIVSRDQSDPATETAMVTRIATTGALTMTSVTLETDSRERMLLAHAGASGQDYDEIWDMRDDPMVLLPGQLLAITAPATFDAGGTWQLSVKGSCVEVP